MRTKPKRGKKLSCMTSHCTVKSENVPCKEKKMGCCFCTRNISASFIGLFFRRQRHRRRRRDTSKNTINGCKKCSLISPIKTNQSLTPDCFLSSAHLNPNRPAVLYSIDPQVSSFTNLITLYLFTLSTLFPRFSCLQGFQARAGGVPERRGHGPDPGRLRRRAGGAHPSPRGSGHHGQEGVSLWILLAFWKSIHTFFITRRASELIFRGN